LIFAPKYPGIELVLRIVISVLGILVSMVGSPAAAFAQAALAGVVRDSSGGLLAGVTVEAISPALIEKSRTAASDENGGYRIENLRPGTYTVTFSLQGWRPYQHEGVELTGSFTATVDAELTPGSFTEALTVTGAIPVLDAHSATHALALKGELIASLPTVRSYNAVLVLVPGVVTSVNDTVTSAAVTSFPIHGGRMSEGRLALDGLNVGTPASAGGVANYVFDVGQAVEITFTEAGALGESETAGLVMQVVPKSGGNTMHGSLFASGTGAKLQADNLTPSLMAQGVRAATPLTKVYDVSGTIGGPIRKDRAWYFIAAHTGGSTKESATVYYNLNAANPAAWLYEPDPSRREYSDRTLENISVRGTWQLTPRNKLTGFWDAQSLCRQCSGATPGIPEPQLVSPEAVGVLPRRLDVWQAMWSSPVTDQLLVEAGFAGTLVDIGNFERSPNPTRDLIRVAEQCASGCTSNGNIPGLVYRSQDFSDAHSGSYVWKASMTRVTGAHSLKIGYQQALLTDDRTWFTNNQNLTYRFNNGVPNQLTQSISPWVNNARVGWGAVFAQDRWSRGRVTVEGTVRFDRAWSWFPAQQQGPSRFLPMPIVIPETRGVDSYKDVTPRMGVAYDLFGAGTTVVKLSVGKYLESAGVHGNYANTNPTLRMPQTTSVFGTAGVTRAWIDANDNREPDCDLSSPGTQDLRASGGDLCGGMSNTAFGTNVLTNSFDPTILAGWGIRPSDWNLGLSIEQQIGRRSAMAVTYRRRWFHEFFVADNLMLQPSDLTPFEIVAPTDPRLPGGGGYIVSGLYDVVPDKAGQVSNLITTSTAYGSWSQYFNGLDVTFDLRAAKGFTVIAGLSTGQTVADNCGVRGRLPELATTTTGTSSFGPGLGESAVTPVSPYCHVAYGWLTQVRGLASYLVPKAEVELAATFQSKPGAMLAANYAVPNADAAPSLGRNLSGNAANVTVNLVAPGTMYGDRLNQLDVRVARTLRYGRSRTRVALDVYNTLNSSAVLTYDNTFVPGGPWLKPLTILTPRFFRVTAELLF
jgi:hypothetical protein